MARLVGNEEFVLEIDKVINRSYYNNIYSYNTFLVLSKLGLRFNELSISNISIVDSDQIKIKGSKGSKDRYFNLVDVPSVLMMNIRDNSLRPFLNSYTSAVRMFKFCLSQNKFFHQRKDLLLHSFRHYYVRKLMLNGANFDTIHDLLGEVNSKSTKHYIEAEIYTNY